MRRHLQYYTINKTETPKENIIRMLNSIMPVEMAINKMTEVSQKSSERLYIKNVLIFASDSNSDIISDITRFQRIALRVVLNKYGWRDNIIRRSVRVHYDRVCLTYLKDKIEELSSMYQKEADKREQRRIEEEIENQKLDNIMKRNFLDDIPNTSLGRLYNNPPPNEKRLYRLLLKVTEQEVDDLASYIIKVMKK